MHYNSFIHSPTERKRIQKGEMRIFGKFSVQTEGKLILLKQTCSHCWDIKLAGSASLYLGTLAGERYTASLGLFQRSRLGTGAPSRPDSKCRQQASDERKARRCNEKADELGCIPGRYSRLRHVWSSQITQHKVGFITQTSQYHCEVSARHLANPDA